MGVGSIGVGEGDVVSGCVLEEVILFRKISPSHPESRTCASNIHSFIPNRTIKLSNS